MEHPNIPAPGSFPVPPDDPAVALAAASPGSSRVVPVPGIPVGVTTPPPSGAGSGSGGVGDDSGSDARPGDGSGMHPVGAARNRGGLRALLNHTLSPTTVTSLMAPIALVALIVLGGVGVIEPEPPWLWLLVLGGITAGNLLLRRYFDQMPRTWAVHVSYFFSVAATCVVIYLTGWGPVLIGAFAITMLIVLDRDGSDRWQLAALWIAAGVVLGQAGISLGVVPSELPAAQANGAAALGAIVLAFVIRLAAASTQHKEEAERATRLSEARFRSLIQNSSDATLVMEADTTCIYASPAVRDIFGFDPEDFVGRAVIDFVHADDRQTMNDRITSQFRADYSRAVARMRMVRQDGTWADIEAVVADLTGEPAVGGYVSNLRDVSERREFEERLAHQALHDPLTRLPNRQLVLDRTDQLLVRARRDRTPIAALMLDLDEFKDTNDSLGHEAGDLLLRSVAARLQALLRSNDTVGRMGGDEFVILVEGASLAAGPELVAERIQEVLREPFSIRGHEELAITVTASIGIATGDRPSANELLRDADIALYRAKALGRGRTVMFDSAMHTGALDRLGLSSELDAALVGDQFFLVYQPVFDLRSGAVSGVEALLRWQHPTRGVVPPDEFIPALEESGRIVDVGRWVLDEACRQAAVWRSRGIVATMSVNVSMRQLETDALAKHVQRAVDQRGLEPSALVLEVTESMLMRDPTSAVDQLQRLKDIGVQLAIDDFGTGYASLAYVRQFPVDILKIDRSFVVDIDGAPDSAALAHTLIELGHTLGLVTVAEGIETEAQLVRLRAEACDKGQGYLFSRPVSAETVEGMFLEHQHRLASGLPVRLRAGGRQPLGTGRW